MYLIGERDLTLEITRGNWGSDRFLGERKKEGIDEIALFEFYTLEFLILQHLQQLKKYRVTVVGSPGRASTA